MDETKKSMAVYHMERNDPKMSPLFEQSVHNSIDFRQGAGQDDSLPL